MSIYNFASFSLYMTKSYINSRDINHYVIYICSSSGKIRLKQVAQYPSYFEHPTLESIQSIQFGHRFPPPCAIHLSVFPIAPFLQFGSLQRFPPPCATHLSVFPFALDLQSGSLQRFPPPCAIHLSVLPIALE